jgi:hypothetical protein
MLICLNAKMFFAMGMTDFDRTLTSFDTQDEQASGNSQNCPSIINANAFSKVSDAVKNLFTQPVLAFA